MLNFEAFVKHGASYYRNECRSAEGGYQCDLVQKTLTFEHSAWYLGAIAAAVILLGAFVFRRRDVNS